MTHFMIIVILMSGYLCVTQQVTLSNKIKDNAIKNMLKMTYGFHNLVHFIVILTKLTMISEFEKFSVPHDEVE